MVAHFDFVVFLVVTGGLLMVLYGPWQTYCEDRARHHIFEARDALFDLAAGGRVSFDAPEYREIRARLNCLIRYAHYVSWPRILFYSRFRNFDNSLPTMAFFAKQIEDEEVRIETLKRVRKAQKALIVLMIQRSPSMWGVFLLIYLAGRYLYSSKMPQARSYYTRRIEADAVSSCS